MEAQQEDERAPGNAAQGAVDPPAAVPPDVQSGAAQHRTESDEPGRVTRAAAAEDDGDVVDLAAEWEAIKEAVLRFMASADVMTLSLKDVKDHVAEVVGKAAAKRHKDELKELANAETMRLLAEKQAEAADEEGGEEESEEEEEDEEEEEEEEDEDEEDDDEDQDYEVIDTIKEKKKRKRQSGKEDKRQAGKKSGRKGKKRKLGRRGDSGDEDSGAEDARPSGKKRAGPVKKAVSSYVLFCQANRAAVKEADPSLGFGEIGSRLGAMWKQLSKEEKAVWQKRAEEDRDRYEREQAQWRLDHPEALGGEEEDEDEPRQRKKSGGGASRRGAASASSGSRRAPLGTAEEDGSAAAAPPRPLSDFDRAVHAARAQRRRPRDDDAEIEATKMTARLFVETMKKAARDDLNAYQRGDVGTSKMKLLADVVHESSKPVLAQELLEAGLLSAFRDWLMPVSEGVLPNPRLRDSLYAILENLNVDAYYLEHSEGLGKILLKFSKVETPENKVRLQKMLHKWARDIFDLPTQYRGLADIEQDQVAEVRARQQAIAATSSANPFQAVRYIPRASVPQPAAFDYAVRPQDRTARSEPAPEDEASIRARQRLVSKGALSGPKSAVLKVLEKRKSRESGQAHQVNIEGH